MPASPNRQAVTPTSPPQAPTAAVGKSTGHTIGRINRAEKLVDMLSNASTRVSFEDITVALDSTDDQARNAIQDARVALAPHGAMVVVAQDPSDPFAPWLYWLTTDPDEIQDYLDLRTASARATWEVTTAVSQAWSASTKVGTLPHLFAESRYIGQQRILEDIERCVAIGR